MFAKCMLCKSAFCTCLCVCVCMCCSSIDIAEIHRLRFQLILVKCIQFSIIPCCCCCCFCIPFELVRRTCVICVSVGGAIHIALQAKDLVFSDFQRSKFRCCARADWSHSIPNVSRIHLTKNLYPLSFPIILLRHFVSITRKFILTIFSMIFLFVITT